MKRKSDQDSNNRSLVESAYQRIKMMILDLSLLPGQTILIDELAEKLGMSRTPVRQAIDRLSSNLEGLVETVPRKGIIVTIPNANAMRELYEIMQGLEGEAVRLAVKNVSAGQLDALEDAIRLQEKALVENDLAGWALADRAFHRLLIEASGNGKLQELVQLFDGQLHRSRLATIHLRTNLEESTADHREILEAIRQGNIGKALIVHTAHREKANERLVKAISEFSGMVMRAAASHQG